ncbi:MAG TPA: ADOP family duplicated permease, partial [Gemmatimonadaceae bacterium]|nr:ADOP family duplicated permease [Gemmatimonadaceae bacterium]
METFARELRHVTRALLRTPGFFAVTVLTLGLGIGATTAIFSVIHGVLLRPLPYPEPDRIVQAWQLDAAGNQMQVSDPNFEDWRAQSRSFAALAEFQGAGVTSVSGGAEPVRARVASVSADFFRALGVRPVLGRVFVPEEQQPGGPPAVVVSHAFWRQQLGGDRSALGRALTFQDNAHTVVGVMPPALDFPGGAELWAPRDLTPRLTSRTAHNSQVLGRLREGVTLEQAREELSAISRRLKQELGDATWMADATVVPLREQLVGGVRQTLLVLLAGSAVLLLIACANVVNLLVARMAAREGEVALRLALGAGRGRLAMQFVAEALVLSLAGGALGLLLAAALLPALLALSPGNLPRAAEIGMSWPVLLFALGISVLAAVALGLLTALRGARGELREAMAQSQRTQAGAGSSYRVRGALVVSQIALTLVLLVGVGLLGRSFLRLLDVRPGYRTERAVVLDLSLPSPSGSDAAAEAARLGRFYDDLVGRLRAIPGVAEVGGVDAFPLTGRNPGNGTFLVMSSPDESVRMEDLTPLFRDSSRTGQADFRVASGGYFRAMGIPLVRGRLFDDRDAPDAPHAALISQTLARTRWPNEDPVGKVIQFGNMDGDLTPFTIVGIVGDVREASLAAEPRPVFYANVRQRARRA